MELVYCELRRLAHWQLQAERAGHTLQPTALVHEAYLRMVDQRRASWKSRTHFLAVAARQMRRVLVDHARKRGALKRGGQPEQTSLEIASEVVGTPGVDVVRLEDALISLSRLDPQQAAIVELRFFGALNIEETAETLGISPSTVKRDWEVAKLWLFRELHAG